MLLRLLGARRRRLLRSLFSSSPSSSIPRVSSQAVSKVERPWYRIGPGYIEVPLLVLRYAISTAKLTGLPLSRVLFSYGTDRLGRTWSTYVRIPARRPEDIDELAEVLEKIAGSS